MNEDDKRLEKAVDGALQLFVELGLTLYEVGETADIIKQRVRVQSNETKIDIKLIQAIIQQRQKQRDEEVAKATQTVFGGELEYVNKE